MDSLCIGYLPWIRHLIITLLVVPAKAGTHTPCPLDIARPAKPSGCGGYGSPPSRGRQQGKYLPPRRNHLGIEPLPLLAFLQHLGRIHHVRRAALDRRADFGIGDDIVALS